MKLNGCNATACTATPLRLAGLQLQVFTTDMAASSRRVYPDVLFMETFITRPRSSSSTSRMALPCSRRRAESLGYAGGGRSVQLTERSSLRTTGFWPVPSIEPDMIDALGTPDELSVTGLVAAFSTSSGGAAGAAGAVTGAALTRRFSVSGGIFRGISRLIGTKRAGFGSARFAAAGGLIKFTNTVKASAGGGIIR